MDELTDHERIFLIELALERLQMLNRYLGLCVNEALHPELEHPHWDEYHVKLAKRHAHPAS